MLLGKFPTNVCVIDIYWNIKVANRKQNWLLVDL